MGKRPKLDAIEPLLLSRENFSLTDAQYQAKAGIPLPKDASYLLSRSALARKSREYGYRLEVQEKTGQFIRISG